MPTSGLFRFNPWLALLNFSIIGLLLFGSKAVRAGSAEDYLDGRSGFFIANKGQWSQDAAFLARAAGVDAWITRTGVVYDFYRNEQSDGPNAATDLQSAASPVGLDRGSAYGSGMRRVGHIVRLNFDGALEAEAVGTQPKSAYFNYFRGKDQGQWASRVPLYNEVLLRNLYSGIDQRLYFEQGRIRYDMIVAPGAEASQIRLSIEAADSLWLSEEGELMIATAIGVVRHGDLFAYQLVDGIKRQVPCRFILESDTGIRFAVGAYDPSLALIIDPLVYSTFLGGREEHEIGRRILVDKQGRATVTGVTHSVDYPLTSGAYQRNFRNSDCFLTTLNAEGSDLVYSTFIGGSERDDATDFTRDGDGNFYLTGNTQSTDFPTSTGAFDDDANGGQDMFGLKLSADGARLLFSSYIGGNGEDRSNGCALSNDGVFYVLGDSKSSDFPTSTNAHERKYQGNGDFVLAALGTDGKTLEYGSYFGGRSLERLTSSWGLGRAVAVDDDGAVYFTGLSHSTDYPTTIGVVQRTLAGNNDIIVTKVHPDSSSLVYSTYYGTSEWENGFSLLLAPDKSVYVTGFTNSKDFPMSSQAYSKEHRGDSYAFVIRVNSRGSSIDASTFFGGSNSGVSSLQTNFFDIVAGPGNSIVLCGETLDKDYPTTPDAYSTELTGFVDGFIAMFNGDLTELLYSTLIGGKLGGNWSRSVDIGPDSSFYVMGETNTPHFPTTAEAYQPTLERNSFGTQTFAQMYVSKIDPQLCFLQAETGADTAVCAGASASLRVSGRGGDESFTYRWQPEEGLDDPHSARPMASPSGTTTYTVTVSAGETCLPAVTTVTVKILPKLVATAGSSQSVCAGEKLVLNGMGRGGTGHLTYAWEPADGLDDPSRPDPKAAPDKTTTYTLHVTDEANCSSTANVEVVVLPELVADAGEDRIVCYGDALELGGAPSGRGGNGRLNYFWSPSDGLDDPGNPNPQLTATTTATYRLDVSDENACVSSAWITVVVQPALQADAGEKQTICPGMSVQLGASPTGKGGSGQLQYSWEPADGLDDPSLANPSVTISSTASYTVFVRDEFGCESSATVVVVSLPIPLADAGPDRIVCSGETTILGAATGPGSDRYTYQWSPNSGLDEVNSPTPMLRLNSAERRTERYTLRVSNHIGCSSSAQVSVTILPELELNILSEKAVVCAGETVALTALARGGSGDSASFTFEWAPRTGLDNWSGPETLFRLDEAGEHRYSVTVRDSAGCSKTAAITLFVREQARLGFDSRELDFGSLGTCESSKTLTISISNDGSEPATLHQVGGAADFDVLTPLPLELPADSSQSIRLRFAPRSEGRKRQWLYFDIAPCAVRDSILVSGESSDLSLSVSASRLDYGLMLSCGPSDSTQTVTLRNSGTQPILFGRPRIAAPFELVSTLPTSLAVGDSRELTLRYTPANIGFHNDVFELPYSNGICDDTLRIPLAGEQREAILRLRPEQIDFARFKNCSRSGDTIVTLRNESPVDIRVQSIEPEGMFTLEPPPPFTIAAHSEKTVLLHFSPVKTGPIASTLTLHYEPCGQKIALPVQTVRSSADADVPATLEFGTLFACYGDSLRLLLPITNISHPATALEISALTIDGPFRTNLQPGDMIAPAARRDFEILFAPQASDADGSYETELKLEFEPCDFNKTIRLRAVKSSSGIEAVDDRHFFGDLPEGIVATRRFAYVNTGRDDARIDSLALRAPDDYRIIQVNSALPTTLAEGDTLWVTLEFRALHSASSGALLIFSSFPCPNAIVVTELSGGVSDKSEEAYALICIDTLRANTGDRLRIPIRLKESDGIAAAAVTGFEMFLSFNPTLLAAVGSTPPGNLIDDKRQIHISGPAPIANGTLHMLEFVAVWGNDSCTDLTIDSVFWHGGQVETQVNSGYLCLDDICNAGGRHRLYLDGAIGQALRVSPLDPSGSDFYVDYDIVAHSPVTISIFDMFGRRRHVLINRRHRPGTYRKALSSLELAAGVYLLVLETQSARTSILFKHRH